MAKKENTVYLFWRNFFRVLLAVGNAITIIKLNEDLHNLWRHDWWIDFFTSIFNFIDGVKEVTWGPIDYVFVKAYPMITEFPSHLKTITLFLFINRIMIINSNLDFYQDITEDEDWSNKYNPLDT